MGHRKRDLENGGNENKTEGKKGIKRVRLRKHTDEKRKDKKEKGKKDSETERNIRKIRYI
jgi:hypothetical protein